MLNNTGSPAWLWPVVGIAVGIGVALAVVAMVVLVWFWRRRQRREQGDHHRRVHHRSIATDSNGESKDWTQCSTEQNKRNGRIAREKDRNGLKKKKQKGKDLRKKRREPLGEDAIRIRWGYFVPLSVFLTGTVCKLLSWALCLSWYTNKNCENAA